MDCRSFHRKLEDYLQGGMDFAGRFGIERHAQQCYGCGVTLKNAQRLGRMARELERVQAPVDFEAALMARIHASKSKRRGALLWKAWVYGTEQVPWRTLAWSAASAAIVGIGIFVALRQAQHEWAIPRTPASAQRIPNRAASSDPGALSPLLSAPEPLSADPSIPVFNPRVVALGDPRARYYPDDDWTRSYVAPEDAGYVDYAVPGPGNRQVIMRLPRSIRLRYAQPSEEYFLQNVSH